MPPENAQLETVLPRKEPMQERSRQRFARILHEATLLIDAQGVDGVAMKDIAARAEISVASLYQYFPDKASIVATLAQQIYGEGQSCVQKIFAEVQTPAQFYPALSDMLDSYLDCFDSVPGAYAIWQATQSDHRLQRLDAEDGALHETTLEDCLRRVAPWLDRDATHLSKIWVGMVAIFVRRAVVLPREEAMQFLNLCKTEALAPSVATALARD